MDPQWAKRTKRKVSISWKNYEGCKDLYIWRNSGAVKKRAWGECCNFLLNFSTKAYYAEKREEGYPIKGSRRILT